MDQVRLAAEVAALERLFPQFRFRNLGGLDPGLIGRLNTRSGGEYIIWMDITGYPFTAPRLYVISPDPLPGFDGMPLSDKGPSHQLHLLAPDAYGHPQICHYNDQFWHPNISLSKIVLKALIWLEAYEQYRKHGTAIEHHLPHMVVG